MTALDSRFVVGLGGPAVTDANLAGTKAANLSRLAARGFRVPAGFVVTTEACDRIMTTAGTSGRAPTGTDIPSEVWAEVLTHLAGLGGRPLAVRSSGSAEDLAGASYAGQYETVLGVEGLEALADAIGRCLASASSDVVRAYTGSEARAPMAVLVQEMVPADAAGVAFTAHPVTGNAEIVVSAVKGLGDRLVSGQATPDEWIVRGDEVSCTRSPEGALDHRQAADIAGLAKAVEELFGSPQDVEWAVCDGEVFVLQARPITALPVAPQVEVPSPGFWMKDTSHFPTPFTPFGASVYLPALSSVFSSLSEELGLLLDGVDQRSMGGEVYMRVVPLGGKDRRPPPPWAMWLAARLVPEFRRRGRAARAAVASRLPERILDSWDAEWRPAFAQEISDLRSVDLAALDDGALVAHLDRLRDLLRRGEELHFRLHVPHAVAVYELGGICQELLGWDIPRALCLLTGSSVASSEAGRELQALAARIADDPAAREAVMAPAGDEVDGLHRSAPWAAEAFEQYLERYGHRTFGYDPGDPTLFERPEIVAALLVEQVQGCAAASSGRHGVPPDAVTQARVELAGRAEEDKARFEGALAFAQRAYGQREDNISWLDNQPCALLRYCAIEFGCRLVERSVLARAGDAVFLEQSELKDALMSRAATDRRGLVTRRKAERAWVMAHPGPASYGKDPGPPPDLSPLPPALRLVNAAFANLVQLIAPPSSLQKAGNELRGLPGSPGLYAGTVRVVRDESEFEKLGPGEVLVAPATAPPWSVLFLRAGAVVTDGGGVLAHTAVIAREYGIPAVLATGSATSRLRDGDRVRVDGSTGVVSVVSATPNAAEPELV